jgi:sigma-70-like protein
MPLFDQLCNFAHRLTRNREEAEDLVQETYVHGHALDWKCAAVTLGRRLAAEGEQHGVIDGERSAIRADQGGSVGFSNATAESNDLRKAVGS